MKRAFFILSLMMVGSLVFGSYGEAQMHHDHQHHEKIEKAENNEVVCPVTNRVMMKSEASASYTFYFASEAAKDAFLKNPAKFLTATCPVMGGEANKLTAPYSNYDGVAYHFCCAGCKEKFEKEPKKYIGKAPQKSEMHSSSSMKKEGASMFDPVCGMQISSEGNIQAEYRGDTYNFCSNRCKVKFEQAPEGYIKK
jgi:YHS domain-containing protein